MSQTDFIPIIKELGGYGIALYALYVMNNLQTAVNNLAAKIEGCPNHE